MCGFLIFEYIDPFSLLKLRNSCRKFRALTNRFLSLKTVYIEFSDRTLQFYVFPDKKRRFDEPLLLRELPYEMDFWDYLNRFKESCGFQMSWLEFLEWCKK